MPSRSSPLFGLELLDYVFRVRLLFTNNFEDHKTGLEGATRFCLGFKKSRNVNSDKTELTVYS